MSRQSSPISAHPGPVVAGVDDDRAAEVIAFAAAMAAATSRRLVLVHVCLAEAPYGPGGGGAAAAHDARLHARQAAAGRWLATLPVPDDAAPHVAVERRVVTTEDDAGTPLDVAGTFTRLAAAEGAVLLVVGGDLGGHAARDLAATAPCPVAVVPRGATPRPVRTIAVAYDATPAAEIARAAALALAPRLGAAVRLLAVAPDDTLVAVPFTSVGEAGARARELVDAVAARTTQPPDGVAVEGEVLRGRASHELVVASFDADLIVCGTRARGPLGRLLLGSVSSALMRFGDCPVIVLPPGLAVAAPDDAAVPATLARPAAPATTAVAS